MKPSPNISRRTFLQGAAAAGAAAAFPTLIPASALGANGAVAPSNRIVMGCIGLGSQGTYNMRAFLGQPDVQVVALCDVNRESSNYYKGGTAGYEPARRIVESYYAERQPAGGYRGCTIYHDFRDLLARKDIDAVTICTPDHWHGLIAVAAAKAGKDIYCEKPLANSVAESRAVRDAVRRYGRVLQTGSHERSRDNARFACELVRNGRIGRLHTIRVNLPIDNHGPIDPQPAMPVPEGFDYDGWLGPAAWAPYTEKRCHFSWRYILDYGSGEMSDRGAHIVDLAQLGNGSDDSGPIEIFGWGKAPQDGLFNTFMEFQFECRYENGVRLIGQSKGPRGLTFEGTEGWVFIHIHGGNLEAEPSSLLQEFIGPGEIHLGRSPGHHRDFLDAVKTRRDPMAPVEVGHHTATLCQLVNIAMLTGERLRWDPKQEKLLDDSAAARLLAPPMRSPWCL